MGVFGWSLPAGCGALPGEEDGASELKIDGCWWAWDESGNVFQHIGKGAEREDGYTYRGWLDPDTELGPEQDWRDTLRAYVVGLASTNSVG